MHPLHNYWKILKQPSMFSVFKEKFTERTHQAYINCVDDDFQTSQTLSILNQLPGFDSVKQFSLDYMHLVCLGVMKKLILYGYKKDPCTSALTLGKLMNCLCH